MKKLLAVIMMLAMLAVSAVAMAAEAKPSIAVIPYINTSAEKKDYIPKTLDEGYTNYFAANGYTVVDAAKVQVALKDSGYTVEDEELPEQYNMAQVAKATGADYVVAMEVAELHASRHMSLFQSKVSAKGKLAYRIYSVKADRVYSFKTSADDDNKTIIGDVGYKTPINNVLNSCMAKGNEKIAAFVAETSK